MANNPDPEECPECASREEDEAEAAWETFLEDRLSEGCTEEDAKAEWEESGRDWARSQREIMKRYE